MVKAEHGHAVKFPSNGAIQANRTVHMGSEYAECVARFCAIRKAFNVALNNRATFGRLSFNDFPYIDPKNGAVVGNPKNVHLSFVLRDPRIALEYYETNPSNIPHVDGIKSEFLQHKFYDEIEYRTSFGFIPNESKDAVPPEFSSLVQFDTVGVNKCKLDIRNSSVPPVVGYLMTRNCMEEILGHYSGHAFYHMNMRQTLTLLEIMARESRADNHNNKANSSFEEYGDSRILIPGSNNNLRFPPTISLKKSDGPYKIYPAYGTIKVYDQTFEVDQPFVPEWERGLPWTVLEPKLEKVIKNTPDYMKLSSHKITHLKLSVRIKTWSLFPRDDVPFDEDDITDDKPFLTSEGCKLRSEMILHQVVEVSSVYLPTKPRTFQADGKFVFVTTNRGYSFHGGSHTFKHFGGEVGCITQHFGNGLPLQAEIECVKQRNSKEDVAALTWFPLINKNIAAEALAYGADKMVSEVVMHKYRNPEEIKLDHVGKISLPSQLAEDPDSVSDENMNRAKASVNRLKSIAKSWSKNFDDKDAKTDPTDGEQPYHILSWAKPYFVFLVLAPVKSVAYALHRAHRVIFYSPQGHLPKGMAYAPAWDLVDVDVNEGGAVDAPRAGMAPPQSPRTAPMRADPMPPPAPVPANSKMAALDSDDELDLREVMLAASQPSVFDHEVYM
jgi:hypothetical protein